MGQRLLVVDNDRVFLDEHKVALEAAFEVDYLRATDGAMPRLERGDVAAVLICVEVSENKGYALCSAIRRSPALQDLRVVLISAKATEEEYARHQSLKGRADLYLHKPIESSALVAGLGAFVPARVGGSEDLLSDLDGVDLGDEWLESLKSELEVDFSSLTEPGLDLEPATTRVLPDTTLAYRVQELEELVRDLEAKNRELAGLAGGSGDLERLQFLEGAHAAAEDELARVRESLALSQDRVQALEALGGQVAPEGASDEHDRQLRLLREDVAGLEATLRGQRRELGEKDLRVQDMEQEVAELRPRAEAALARAAELEATHDALMDEAEGLGRELESARAQLQGREQLTAQAETRAGELEAQLAELQDGLGEAEAERESLRAELEECRVQLAQAEARNGELETVSAGFQTRLEEAAIEQELLQTDLEACQARLAQAETELAEKSTLALRQEQELLALGEQFEAARSTRERQADELGELRGSLETLEAGLQARQQELDSVTAERDQAQVRCTELEERQAREAQEGETQRMELLAGIDEREASLTRLKTAVEELETRVSGLEKEKRELDGHLNERTALLGNLTEVISDLEAGIRRATDLTRPF